MLALIMSATALAISLIAYLVMFFKERNESGYKYFKNAKPAPQAQLYPVRRSLDELNQTKQEC